MSAKHLGTYLYQVRKQRGITQSTVARYSGLSRNMVALVERGEVVPTIETLAKLYRCLNFSMTEVLFRWRINDIPVAPDYEI